MGIKTYNPYTPSRRNMTGSDFSEITKTTPEKSLVVSLKKNAGRKHDAEWKYGAERKLDLLLRHDKYRKILPELRRTEAGGNPVPL